MSVRIAVDSVRDNVASSRERIDVPSWQFTPIVAALTPQSENSTRLDASVGIHLRESQT